MQVKNINDTIFPVSLLIKEDCSLTLCNSSNHIINCQSRVFVLQIERLHVERTMQSGAVGDP